MITTKLFSSTTFDQLTDLILSESNLERYQKLSLHTWFSKTNFNQPEQLKIMCEKLFDYLSAGEKNSFLVNTTISHPKMFAWFGDPLVGNETAINLLRNIKDELSIPVKYIASDFLSEVEEYFIKMEPASILMNLLGSEIEIEELRVVICRELPNPYNVHPDTVVHKRMDNKLWYIAGVGHEFGHILTWGLNNELRSLGLLSSPAVRQFPEMLAHLCNKLLLDYYRYSINDLAPDCHDWSQFGFSQNHPGIELYKELLDTVNIENAKDLREFSIDLLSQYQ